jgi:hypothetical protein
MELDDLKSVWKADQGQRSEVEEREVILQIIRRSDRGISKMLKWELAVGGLGALLYLVVIFYFDQKINSFHYKLIVPIVLFALPIYYRLYRSRESLRNMDYSGDVRSTLTSFLTYYKKTLLIYQWGTYAAFVMLAIVFATDQQFKTLKFWWQAAVYAYLAVGMLLAGPLVKRLYGHKVKAIEAYLAD